MSQPMVINLRGKLVTKLIALILTTVAVEP